MWVLPWNDRTHTKEASPLPSETFVLSYENTVPPHFSVVQDGDNCIGIPGWRSESPCSLSLLSRNNVDTLLHINIERSCPLLEFLKRTITGQIAEKQSLHTVRSFLGGAGYCGIPSMFQKMYISFDNFKSMPTYG